MPYKAEIKREQPGLLIFLLDQSGSMDKPFGGDGSQNKASALSDALNKLLQTLVNKCTKGEGKVYDYFDVGIIGYTTDGHGTPKVYSAFQGDLKGKNLITTSMLAVNPLRIDKRIRKISDGAGGLVSVEENFPVWIEPTTEYGTPIGSAFEYVLPLAEKWVKEHAEHFPPIVLHITDGESTENDKDHVGLANKLKCMATNDGETLVLNLHISSHESLPVLCPNDENKLPADPYARELFEMSSVLPEVILEEAKKEGWPVAEGSRGFIFNADMVKMIEFLDIGTRGVQNRLL